MRCVYSQFENLNNRKWSFNDIYFYKNLDIKMIKCRRKLKLHRKDSLNREKMLKKRIEDSEKSNQFSIALVIPEIWALKYTLFSIFSVHNLRIKLLFDWINICSIQFLSYIFREERIIFSILWIHYVDQDQSLVAICTIRSLIHSLISNYLIPFYIF